MQLNALLCCLWRNVEASCHKHFVVFSRNQHRRLLPAMCHNLRDHQRLCLQHLACCSVNTGSQARYRLRIAISTYPMHLHSTPPLGGGVPSEYRHPVWYGKPRMAWLYATVKKNSKISLFVLTECTNVTDTRTDRQTQHGGIGRACIASRGKNVAIDGVKNCRQVKKTDMIPL